MGLVADNMDSMECQLLRGEAGSFTFSCKQSALSRETLLSGLHDLSDISFHFNPGIALVGSTLQGHVGDATHSMYSSENTRKLECSWLPG